MRKGTPTNLSLQRALGLLARIVEDGGRQTLSAIASEHGIPLASAHRLATTFVRSNYLLVGKKGHYHAGPALAKMGAYVRLADTAVRVARPILEPLASTFGSTAHLGIFEHDMVTYLLRTGKTGDGVFTREGIQLEAYCSGIGKVLLASLPEEERETYIRGGPFVQLTANTITDPDALRHELDTVRTRGHAIDNREVAEDIYCIAVPLMDHHDRVFSAISLSASPTHLEKQSEAALNALHSSAKLIEAALTP